MTSFLNLVASDLLTQYGCDMRQLTVVFPGKRAGMFLDREFPALTDKPVWTPTYCTMGDLFHALTPLQVADPLECICILHGVMQEVLGETYTETLDQFWSWGEVLMADFDDIDKHLADARAIFTNIYEDGRLQDLSYLDEEQTQTLSRFFGRFWLEGSTAMKEHFLHVWGNMYQIYGTLKQRLLDEGKLWEGALFRHVTEQMQQDETLIQKLLEGRQAVAFAGFNVLNRVEQSMMQAVKREGKARFYWDYDVYYCDGEREHEAGHFMRDNLRRFPSAIGPEAFDNFRHLQDVTFIACTTDNAAARYANAWISEHASSAEERRAVILCNEALMQPLLHTIPEDSGMVNVTMGFPIADTPVHGILMSLLRLQLEGWDAGRACFRHHFVQTLRQQPLFGMLHEADCLRYAADSTPALMDYLLGLLQQIATHYARIEEPDILQQLYGEAVYRTYSILTVLRGMTQREEHPLEVQPSTMRRLLRTMLASAKIPFHSEPDQGMQMMGMLETRCLDFQHMLMLSVEEGNLPQGVHSNSFIPANIREGFGLTTPRHRISVYAYYFYRLVQRAEHLTCVYNESAGEGGQHEMSRFLRQILAETDIPVQTRWLRSEPKMKTPLLNRVEKTPEVIAKLRQRYDINIPGSRGVVLSPSAINVFMECPMHFYLEHILGIRCEDEAEDGVSASIIGSIFHDAAELFYDWLQRKVGTNNITSEMTCEQKGEDEYVIRDSIYRQLQLVLHTSFDVNWFHPTQDHDRTPELKRRLPLIKEIVAGNSYKGSVLIVHDVLLRYLSNLIRYDARHAPFRLIGVEQDCQMELTMPVPEGVEGCPEIRIKTGGRIDRLDEMKGHIRIVDYKTGSTVPEHNKVKMETVLSQKGQHEKYYLQTFLYALAVAQSPVATKPVKPVLFYPGKATTKDYDPSLQIDQVVVNDFQEEHAAAFKEGLTRVIRSIFDPAVPFTCAPDDSTCKYCKLKLFCGKV